MRITRTKYFDKSFAEIEKGNPRMVLTFLKKIELLREGKILRESLSGYNDLYKIRMGKYRLIYTIRDGVLIILLTIKKREVAYKDLDKVLRSISQK